MDSISENFESLLGFNKLFSDLSKEKEDISENLKIIYQSSLWRTDLYVSLDIIHFITFMFNTEELNQCMAKIHFDLMRLTLYYGDIMKHPTSFELKSYIEKLNILIMNMEQLIDVLCETTDGVTIKGYDKGYASLGLNKEITSFVSIEDICNDYLKRNIMNINESKKFIQEYFENKKYD